MESAAAYIRASDARHVRVVGYAGDARLDNKRVLHERKTVAEERANLVADALKQLGVEAAVITVDWRAEAAPGDGVHDPDHRKAVIEIHL